MWELSVVYYPANIRRKNFEDMLMDLEKDMLSGFCFGMPIFKGTLGDIGMNVDVRDHDNEVVVAADLPGVEKDDISLALIDPQTLEITCRRGVERNEGKEEGGYFIQERAYGSMSRVVRLPAPAIEDGSTATFNNGVLEVRLKKTSIETGKKIPIA